MGSDVQNWSAQDQIPILAAGERSTKLARVSFPSFQKGSNGPNLAGLFKNQLSRSPRDQCSGSFNYYSYQH